MGMYGRLVRVPASDWASFCEDDDAVERLIACASLGVNESGPAVRERLEATIATLRATPGTEAVVASLEAELANPPEPLEAGRVLILRKAWDAFRWTFERNAPALATATTGDGSHTVGRDGAFGPASYFDPARVASIAAALRVFPEAKLVAEHASGALGRANVHGGYGRDANDEEERAYLLADLHALVQFYGDAAARGDYVIVVIS